MASAYKTIFPRRSDGQRVVENVPNCPTAKQQDQKEDADGGRDYYRILDASSAKHQDWMKKLGQMVADMNGAPPTSGYILTSLPENYQLWEHVKSRGNVDGSGPKSHGGGGNDRTDTYLYGHPGGITKRFRSPKEFFPHLFWLLSDPKGDRDNCHCKLCGPPEEVQKNLKRKGHIPGQVIGNSAGDSAPAAAAPAAIPASSNVVGTNPQAVIGSKSPSTGAAPRRSPPGATRPAPQQQQLQPRPPQPTMTTSYQHQLQYPYEWSSGPSPQAYATNWMQPMHQQQTTYQMPHNQGPYGYQMPTGHAAPSQPQHYQFQQRPGTQQPHGQQPQQPQQPPQQPPHGQGDGSGYSPFGA